MKNCLIIVSAVLALLSCQPENILPDEFLLAIPDASVVTLEIPGDDLEQTQQALELAKADGDVKAKIYLETINGVRGINAMTWGLLHLVDDITASPYTS